MIRTNKDVAKQLQLASAFGVRKRSAVAGIRRRQIEAVRRVTAHTFLQDPFTGERQCLCGYKVDARSWALGDYEKGGCYR